MGEGCGGKGEEVRGLRSTNRWLQNSPGDVKYSTGYGVAKEITHMTHGREPWGGLPEGVGGCCKERGTGGKSGQLQ